MDYQFRNAMTFDQFVASNLRKSWIDEGGIAIYVRRSYPQWKRGDFDLATLVANVRGHGALTRFLDTYERSHQFYIENVMRERLRDFFIRRGYEVYNDNSKETGMWSLLGPLPARKE